MGHRRVESERAQKKEELVNLREHEMLCSNALTESLQKKDRVLAELQGALRDQKDSPEKRKGKLSLLRSKPDAAVVAAAESRVQKATSSQTAVIEELAERTDEAMLARMRADEGAQAFRETLGRVDTERRQALHKSI